MRGARSTRWFVLAGLLVALGLAVVLSPYASDAPDGLERVAEDRGFDATADEHHLADSPVADYGVDGVEDERLSTGLAGLAGVLLTFGVGAALFGLVARRPGPSSGTGTPRSGERAPVA